MTKVTRETFVEILNRRGRERMKGFTMNFACLELDGYDCVVLELPDGLRNVTPREPYDSANPGEYLVSAAAKGDEEIDAFMHRLHLGVSRGVLP